MLQVDLHVHSLFSACGLHTVLELLEQARRIGLKALAITDHGLAVGGGRLNSVFFERFHSPYSDVILYKGIELNILDEKGAVDIVWRYLPFIDILLLGLHPNLPTGRSKNYYTDAVIAAIDAHPFIDILTHLNDPMYPVDYKRVAQKAATAGMAIELNNSKVLYSRSSIEDTLDLVFSCKEIGCRMAVNSDTHAILELGGDDAVRPILEKARFPEELIVNADVARTAEFIESRRSLKRAATAGLKRAR